MAAAPARGGARGRGRIRREEGPRWCRGTCAHMVRFSASGFQFGSSRPAVGDLGWSKPEVPSSCSVSSCCFSLQGSNVSLRRRGSGACWPLATLARLWSPWHALPAASVPSSARPPCSKKKREGEDAPGAEPPCTAARTEEEARKEKQGRRKRRSGAARSQSIVLNVCGIEIFLSF